ncbi:hypothetical protein [Telluribacter sp.]|jgi:hypothetical protein|uniref:hypothetical protein n=1 Tax=Telluribacter sp. TaxID=1978767 RepID=UPI002E142A4E|nr:hypothetical protein [Telluribacter sp.]
MKPCLLVLLLTGLLASPQVPAQNTATRWYLTPNVNLYLPKGNSYKDVFPLISVNREETPRVLVGGFGLGGAVLSPVAWNLKLKAQANLSKNTYWDSPLDVRAANGLSRGEFRGEASDYNLGFTGTFQYSLTEQLSVGTGVGGRFLLISLARMPDFENLTRLTRGGLYKNKHYRRFVPVVPVEFSYKLSEIILNLRYEVGLTSNMKWKYRKSIPDKNDLLVLEVGIPFR